VINPTNKTVSDETKQLIDQLLLERISLRGIARVTGVSWSWLQNYVNNKLAAVPRQVKVSDKPKGKLFRECDEMWSLVFSKTIKVYIWRLIDRKTREIIGCYLGYAEKVFPGDRVWGVGCGVMGVGSAGVGRLKLPFA
jgi:hypothetical protein